MHNSDFSLCVRWLIVVDGWKMAPWCDWPLLCDLRLGAAKNDLVPALWLATSLTHQLLQMDAAKINWPAFSSVQNKIKTTIGDFVLLYLEFKLKAFLYNLTPVFQSCHLFCLEPKIRWKWHSGRTGLIHASAMWVFTTNNNCWHELSGNSKREVPMGAGLLVFTQLGSLRSLLTAATRIAIVDSPWGPTIVWANLLFPVWALDTQCQLLQLDLPPESPLHSLPSPCPHPLALFPLSHVSEDIVAKSSHPLPHLNSHIRGPRRPCAVAPLVKGGQRAHFGGEGFLDEKVCTDRVSPTCHSA